MAISKLAQARKNEYGLYGRANTPAEIAKLKAKIEEWKRKKKAERERAASAARSLRTNAIGEQIGNSLSKSDLDRMRTPGTY